MAEEKEKKEEKKQDGEKKESKKFSGYAESTKFLSHEEAKKQRRWWLVDAKGKVVGRLASRIAVLLMGKHKPTWTPHEDMGDFVVVINARHVVFTGKKWEQKLYRWHSGYPGGLKEMKAKDMLRKFPERILYLAVKGMLPKNFLRDRMLKRLKIYPDATHPHQAQKPVPIKID